MQNSELLSKATCKIWVLICGCQQLCSSWALLSLLLEKYQACNNKKAIEKLKKISPAAWQNIHLTGQHPFYTDKHPIDLEKMLMHLENTGLD
jgi:hypothetical protein